MSAEKVNFLLLPLSPTVHLDGVRGMAGSERKLLLARIEREKKTGVKKSKKLKIYKVRM
jgi:hypothetical protein